MYRIDPMTQEDVAEVGRVERRCFSNPWPVSAYRRELQAPQQNYYVVLRRAAPEAADAAGPAANGNGRYGEGANGHGPSGQRPVPRRTLLPLGLSRRGEGNGAARPGREPILGFAGMWVLYDEAHITTIGVEPGERGKGLGELLLVAMFDEAIRRGATWLTLEVRVSNEPAQALYRKYGFAVQGTRKRYYSDNNEDAHVMWSRSLQDPAYRSELAELRRALLVRLDQEATSHRL
ncbi:MAG: ribosomal protein S18-alanine N-acetyltransferase [Chloroflexota bacterium]|nr:ribosomal protein S18-alanine N-acetyltransferase [Chloroflexota bacterium]